MTVVTANSASSLCARCADRTLTFHQM